MPRAVAIALLVLAKTLNFCIVKPSSDVFSQTDLGPQFHKHNARLTCARDADRHLDVGALILHYQVVSDSPGGATSNIK